MDFGKKNFLQYSLPEKLLSSLTNENGSVKKARPLAKSLTTFLLLTKTTIKITNKTTNKICVTNKILL